MSEIETESPALTDSSPESSAKSIRASQLIYTNVEERRSPNRRRGFQLWLYSKDIPVAVRDELELRLSGFTRPTDLKEPPVDQLVRRIFSRLNAKSDTGDEYVFVAEAVQLKDPDKFGRGGRFIAHALIFNAREFGTLAGNNPYAIFDAGFEFNRDPNNRDTISDEIIQRVKELPAVEITPVEPRFEPLPVEFEGQYGLFLKRVVTRDDIGMPLAVPVLPATLERLIRQLFPRLPISLRTRLNFDTLWHGQGTFGYCLVGSGTSKGMQGWSNREFKQYNLETRAIQPEMQWKNDWRESLAQQWADSAEIPEPERANAWQFGEWLYSKSTFPVPDIMESSESWMRNNSDLLDRFKNKFTVCITKRVFEVIPDESLRLEFNVKEYASAEYDYGRLRLSGFANLRLSGFAKLNQPLERVKVASWIKDLLKNATTSGSTISSDIAEKLLSWCGDDQEDDIKKLRVMAYRWMPEYAEELRSFLLHEKHDWFREYCWQTLPEPIRTLTNVDSLKDSFLKTGKVDHANLTIYEIIESRKMVDGPPPLMSKQMQFFSNCRPEKCHSFLVRIKEDLELRTWLREEILKGLEKKTPEYAAYTVGEAKDELWSQFFRNFSLSKKPLAIIGSRIQLNLGSSPTLEDSRIVLLNAIVTMREYRDDLKLAFCRFADPQNYPAGKLVGDDAKNRMGPIATLLHRKSAVGIRNQIESYQLDGTFVALFDEFLSDKLDGLFVAGLLPDGHSYFFGTAVTISDTKAEERAELLFRCIIESMMNYQRIDGEGKLWIESRFIGRFEWLVMRLSNVVGNQTRIIR